MPGRSSEICSCGTQQLGAGDVDSLLQQQHPALSERASRFTRHEGPHPESAAEGRRPDAVLLEQGQQRLHGQDSRPGSRAQPAADSPRKGQSLSSDAYISSVSSSNRCFNTQRGPSKGIPGDAKCVTHILGGDNKEVKERRQNLVDVYVKNALTLTCKCH